MSETFATLKIKVKSFLQHSNITNISGSDISGDLINMAMHTLEQRFNWKGMESRTSGNLTSSVDYITAPTRYKEMKCLIITENNRQKVLAKKDYKDLFAVYYDGSNVKREPEAFCYSPVDTKIIVRPYPDTTYAYELLTYNYSADLSADSDTNYWLDNAWEVLLYAAIVEGGNFLRIERLADFVGILEQKLGVLRLTEIKEQWAGSYHSINPFVVV